VTGERDVSRETSSPWQQYLNREHAARDQYLATVQAAHREYLAGPWADRGYYLTVERDAYATYYTAGRAAWQSYRAAMETRPPDIVTPGPLATAARDEWLATNNSPVAPPPPDSYPYPVPQSVVITDDLHHGQATFTPYPRRVPESIAGAQWPVPPGFTVRPGNGQPSEPDQWPASFPADNHRPESES